MCKLLQAALRLNKKKLEEKDEIEIRRQFRRNLVILKYQI